MDAIVESKFFKNFAKGKTHSLSQPFISNSNSHKVKRYCFTSRPLSVGSIYLHSEVLPLYGVLNATNLYNICLREMKSLVELGTHFYVFWRVWNQVHHYIAL